MTLEQQVVSLELSKKLKELGVEQDSLYKWCIYDKTSDFYIGEKDRLFTQKEWEDFTDEYNPSESEFYSAFTVAELGEMLPDYHTSDKQKGKWYSIKIGKQVLINKKPVLLDKKEGYFLEVIHDADTEANVRAKMLIYLIENNLYSPLKG